MVKLMVPLLSVFTIQHFGAFSSNKVLQHFLHHQMFKRLATTANKATARISSEKQLFRNNYILTNCLEVVYFNIEFFSLKSRAYNCFASRQKMKVGLPMNGE